MSSNAPANIATVNKQCKQEQNCGINNWLIIMLALFAAFMVADNYLRCTTITDPIEIGFSALKEVVQHSRLFYITTICYFVQIVQSFLLENLLASNLVSESVGMVLHAVNVFFLPTTFIVTARVTGANPLISRVMITYIMYSMTKVWSYAYVNKTYREASQQKKKTDTKDNTIFTQYPSNVTWRNIIEYLVFTPPVQYQVSYPKRTSPQWKAFVKYFLQFILVYYLTALLLIHFILPELNAFKSGYDSNLQMFKGIIKISLCTNCLWILYSYIHIYRVYLSGYATLTGMQNIVFCKDWWNSETVNIFWRKWNLPVHNCLKYNVAIPLIRNGYSSMSATVVCFAVAGVIHEYVNTLPFGIYNGTGFLCTLLEIPAGYVSDYVTRTFGNRCGNFFLWIYLMSTHLMAVLHFSSYLPHVN